MYQTIRLSFIAAGLFLGVGSASAHTIKILSATYGGAGAAARCDATSPVASLCNGTAHCTVDIRNTSMCGDPDFLVVKQSTIRYSCGRRIVDLVASEYSSADIACQ